jgi:hypothetical protein
VTAATSAAIAAWATFVVVTGTAIWLIAHTRRSTALVRDRRRQNRFDPAPAAVDTPRPLGNDDRPAARRGLGRGLGDLLGVDDRPMVTITISPPRRTE